jgi:hypothetical protein
VPGLREYRYFIDDLESELSRIGVLLEREGASGTPCRQGCSDCCRPLSVLPLEAFSITSCCEVGGVGSGTLTSNPRSCPFLTTDDVCAIYPARPFLCRTRGFPILHMNGDGDWERDACVKRGFPLRGAPGLELSTWNARLFRLNDDFCRQHGILAVRVQIGDLRPVHAATSPVVR